MGTYTLPATKKGQKCVIKHNKKYYRWKREDWDDQVIEVP